MFSAQFSGFLLQSVWYPIPWFCYRASGTRFHGFVTERLVTDSMDLLQNVCNA